GYSIAMRTSDRFGALLASGITFALLTQAAINIGVATGLLPVTGLTLPFISYGGSSLIVSLAMTGILFNIAQGASHENGARLWRRDGRASLSRAGYLRRAV
ncbi:FtsW/RodA/SpoVE family cell cycle protein, partial [Candidatus Acetothermia bacterium]|nr:FtsW/RodA/SpoVE family cell cycle protein [Candidatus Acetothermia bacterium]